jgi:hypothetical protein
MNAASVTANRTKKPFFIAVFLLRCVMVNTLCRAVISPDIICRMTQAPVGVKTWNASKNSADKDDVTTLLFVYKFLTLVSVHPEIGKFVRDQGVRKI